MLPGSRDEAIRPAPKYTAAVDLAAATKLRTDKPIPDPQRLTRLRLRIKGRTCPAFPRTDIRPLPAKEAPGSSDVHPRRLKQSPGKSIVEAARGMGAWTKPSLHIPSSSPRFRRLAKDIVGDRKDVRSASLAIRAYVQRTMNPNAGIGVLRDASEVLDTKEGVCRDYAILTATLARAAGIPARLASGLVSPDGTFYYHAWVEAWDGARWIGLDSTLRQDQISASHVKLAHGNVEGAFNFTFLEHAILEVLDARKD